MNNFVIVNYRLVKNAYGVESAFGKGKVKISSIEVTVIQDGH